jgi:uncharacterized RDD family membrane protein YckC
MEAEAGVGPAWREELSARVESFRRRRARLKAGFNRSANLDLDFDARPEGEPLPDSKELAPQEEKELDVVLESSVPPEPATVPLESLLLERTGTGIRILSSAAVDAGEIPLEPSGAAAAPVEIVLESSQLAPEETSPDSDQPPLLLAPLGRRFLAGVTDALVLLAGSGLFALVFWLAGGRLSLNPVTLAVLGSILVFFLMAYFGLFTALIFSTPGLLTLGLEVRNLEGQYPTTRESFWRAFGYLISTAALMLGFIWAMVDSDGLTWHDRMSGTFVSMIED